MMFQFHFTLSTARSNQKAFSNDEITEMRDKLQNEIEKICEEFDIPPDRVLNTDEAPVDPLRRNESGYRKVCQCFKHEGKTLSVVTPRQK